MRDSIFSIDFNLYKDKSLILLSLLFLVILISNFSFVSSLEVLGNETIYSTGITEGVVIFNTTAINVSSIPHNTLTGLQGGNTSQYYHLNLSVFTKLMNDIYNFITGTDTPKYLSVANNNVSFNETALNETIDARSNGTGVFVPYNGSLINVDLNNKNLTADWVHANVNATNVSVINLNATNVTATNIHSTSTTTTGNTNIGGDLTVNGTISGTINASSIIHNNLSGLNGTGPDYYHLNSSEYQQVTNFTNYSGETYVPYTGAIKDVNLDGHNLNATNVTAVRLITSGDVYIGGDLNVNGTRIKGNASDIPITVCHINSVACYRFEEGSGSIVADTSKYLNPGFIKSDIYNASKGGNGTGSYCLNSSGTSNGYVVADSAPQINLTDNFTVSAWVYLTLSSDNNWIMSKNNDPSLNNGFMFYIKANDKIHFNVKKNGVTTQKRSSGTIPLNTWHHVAGTINNSVINLYIDGVNQTLENPIDSLAGTSTSLFLGIRSDITRYFTGYYDEVGIENVILNATEIANISQNGFPLVNDTYPGFTDSPFTVTRTTPGDIIIVDKYGRTGIKNPNPITTFDVNGTGRFTALQVTNDLTVTGTIIGGSPVKISGGLLIVGGDANTTGSDSLGGAIRFNNESNFIRYNTTSQTVELWANGVLQQDWGNSTTIYGKATFQSDAFFQNLSGQGLFINTNVLVDGNITSFGYGNFTEIFAGNICYSNGTNCTYINGSLSNLTDAILNLSSRLDELNASLIALNQSLTNDYYNKTTIDSNMSKYRLKSVQINASEVNKTSGTYYLNLLLDAIIDTLAINIDTVNQSVQTINSTFSWQINEINANISLINNTTNQLINNVSTINSTLSNQINETNANLSSINNSFNNFVPYNGSNQNVDLNNKNLTAAWINANLNGTNITLNGTLLFAERTGVSNLISVNPYNSDGFRMEYWYDFELTNDDWLVFRKTDGNDERPDGGIAFMMSNASGWNKTILKLDGYGTANFTDYNIITTGDIIAGNICYSNGTNCTYINSSIVNLTVLISEINDTLYGNLSELNTTLYTDYYNKTQVDNNFTLYRLISVFINTSEVNKTTGAYYLNMFLDTIIDTLVNNINTVNSTLIWRFNETNNNISLINNTVNNNTYNINILNSSITNLSNNVTNQINEVYANISEVNNSIANATVNYSYYSNYSTTSGQSNYSNYSGYSDLANYSNYTNYSDYAGQSIDSQNANYSNFSNYSNYAGQANTAIDSNYSNYSNYSFYSNYTEYINEARYNLTVINYSITQTNLNLTNQINEAMANLSLVNQTLNHTILNFTNQINEIYANLSNINDSVRDTNLNLTNQINEVYANLSSVNASINYSDWALNQSIKNTNLNLTNQFNEVYANLSSFNNTLYFAQLNFTNQINELRNNLSSVNSTLLQMINLTNLNLTNQFVEVYANLSNINSSLNNDYYNKTTIEANFSNYYNKTTIDSNFTLYRLISVMINTSEINKTTGIYYLNQLLDSIIDTLAININTVNQSVQSVNSTLNWRINETQANLTLINNTLNNLTNNVSNINTTLTNAITSTNNNLNETNANLTLINNTLNNATQNINTLNQSITNLSNNVTNQFNETYSNISSMNNTTNNNTQNINTLNQSITNLSNNVTNQFNEVYANITSVNVSFNETNANLSLINQTVNNNTQNINTLNSSITNLSLNITNQLNELYANISAINSSINYSDWALNESIRQTNLNLTNQFQEVLGNLSAINNSIRDTNNNLTNRINEVYANLSSINQSMINNDTYLQIQITETKANLTSMNNTLNYAQLNFTNQLNELYANLSSVNASINYSDYTLNISIQQTNNNLTNRFNEVYSNLTSMNNTLNYAQTNFTNQFNELYSNLSNVNSSLLQLINLTNLNLTNQFNEVYANLTWINNSVVAMNTTLNNAVQQISELQANMTSINNTLNNLTYNLSNYYVPYNNATHNLDLGNYNITTQNITANDSSFNMSNITTATVTNLLGVVQAVIGTLNATTGNIGNVNSSVVNSINAVITTVNATNAYFVTLNVSNIYTNWISANNANITNANITNLNATNVTSQNITSVSVSATTGSFGNIYNKSEVDALQKNTIGPYLYNNTTHYQFNETYLNNTIGNISEIKQFEEYIYVTTSGGIGSNISSVINYIIKEIRVMPSSNSSKYRFKATETTGGEIIDSDLALHTGVWDIRKNHVIYNDSVTINITNSNPAVETYTIKLTYLNNGLA